MDAKQAEYYLAEGQFGTGSMAPKVEAAIRFVQSGSGREVIITSLEYARRSIEGEGGTHIVAGEEPR
jgi:carbamate kinase